MVIQQCRTVLKVLNAGVGAIMLDWTTMMMGC